MQIDHAHPRRQPPCPSRSAARLLGGARSLMGAIALGSVLLGSAGDALAGGTLRIAMTSSDIPLPNGQTDQGAEGMRFMGYTVFEALVAYDLSSADKPVTLIPGLATGWQVDAQDKTRWVFTLRPGVKFHDGSDFNAQAVVWNLGKILDPNAEQFDARQAAQGRGRVPSVKQYRALDAMTVEIITSEPDALIPYEMAWIVMSSPQQWQNQGKNWDAFLKSPSGTGPWKLQSYTPRERAVLVRNDGYWDTSRVPKLDSMVLLPVPDPSARVAALRSGQVDWIEAPPPDSLDSLKGAGFALVSNVYPHIWPWHFSRIEGSPWNDIRVRKAANLAVDREGMKALLGGMMVPAKGMVPPNSPWFGHPEFDVRYDPAQAKALMAEAGYTPDKPQHVKVIISPAGGGQMQPQLMNELIQQNLAAVGIQVEFDVRDWNGLLANWRAGVKDAGSKNATATNSSYFSQDPFTALIRHLDSRLMPPKGTNWGFYSDPQMDALFDGIRTEFDPTAQLGLIQKAHEKYVNDALFLFVAHDVAPRAISAKVEGVVPAQNWFLDFSGIDLKP